MAIPLLVANFNPVGPALFIALLGVGTIFFVWWVVREFFPTEKENWGALVAAFLYAISPVIIIYSRSSWNPNIMPFFSLVCIYGMWRVMIKQQIKWLVVVAISFAFVLQSHYLGLLLFPVLLIYWLFAHVPKKYSLFSILLFLFLMSPLLVFDIRHNFLNSKALYKFIIVRQETMSIRPWTAIPKTYPIFEQINSSLLTAKTEPLGKIVSIFIILFLVLIPFLNKKIIIIWLFSGLIGLSLYKQNVYDHYFGFMFPIPFLLIGFFWEKLYNSKYKIFGILFLAILIFINLTNNPLRNSPNNQMKRAVNVANKIIEESKGQNFNIAVVAEQNYEDGYQYFLEKEKSKFVEIDAQIEKSVTNQLFVVCEVEESKCDPTHSAKAEIANFGWSKIDEFYMVDGVIIYKLVHSK